MPIKRIHLLFVCLFFVIPTLRSQEDFFKSITSLRFKSDSLTIKQALTEFKNGNFLPPVDNHLFQEIQGQEATWLHLNIPASNDVQYLSIWNTFLDFSELYLVNSNNEITKKQTFSLLTKNSFPPSNRFPNWKIQPHKKNLNAFIKIKDFNIKTNLKILLQNSQEFNNGKLNDYNSIIALTVFLAVLWLFILLLFIAKKDLSLFWYSLYILLFLGEFLLHKGVHLAFNFLNIPIFNATSQMFVPNIALFFVCLFFIQFYNYNKTIKWIQNGFKILAYFFGFLTLIFVIFFLSNTILFPKEFIIIPSRIAVLVILVLNVILVFKRAIPWYLGFSFGLPIITFFVFSTSQLSMNSSLGQLLFFDSSVYFATAVSICFVIYYIVKQLIKSEFKTITLQNENLNLRNNFQDRILKIQQQERNKLLNNVHDSFGGYLEALKIRLLQKQENTEEKIQEILDGFYKEYRFLLNSLYSPKINSENFVENLVEFCGKINQLTNGSISHNFSLENTQLSQDKCVHLYRIISELITNAVKYSKSSEININIQQKNNSELHLTVSDNGIGFDVTKIGSNSYGLNTIKNRVKEMNGTVKINSKKNSGTIVKICIPRNE